ncbi:hypothetical protein G7085_01105 [Tessaracoccus sp. HDW20]|nr:hypothetical protein [Tessaracoccus coleopterorum]
MARLVDCHDASWCGEDQFGRAIQMCSPWARRSHQHFVLTDPVALAEPVQTRSRWGLWEPAERVRDAVFRQHGPELG